MTGRIFSVQQTRLDIAVNLLDCSYLFAVAWLASDWCVCQNDGNVRVFREVGAESVTDFPVHSLQPKDLTYARQTVEKSGP